MDRVGFVARQSAVRLPRAMVAGPGCPGHRAVACHPRDRPGPPRPVRRRRRQIRSASSPARLRGSSSGQAARPPSASRRRMPVRPVPTFGSGPRERGAGAGEGDVPPTSRRWRGRRPSAARHACRPVIEPAVCAFGADYPQHRHPGDTVDRALGRHARAAFVPPDCHRRPPSSRWPRRPRLHRNPRAGLRRPRHRRPHTAPRAKDPLAPSDSGAAQIPDSFRVGYAEYLRSATTSDLFARRSPA